MKRSAMKSSMLEVLRYGSNSVLVAKRIFAPDENAMHWSENDLLGASRLFETHE